jgi:hypothetical protein
LTSSSGASGWELTRGTIKSENGQGSQNGQFRVQGVGAFIVWELPLDAPRGLREKSP